MKRYDFSRPRPNPWGKVGAGRHDTSGEGSYRNYIFFEVGGSRLARFELDGTTPELWLGTGSGNPGLQLYGANTGTATIFFMDALSGSSGGRIRYDHSDDSFDIMPTGSTKLRIDSDLTLFSYNGSYCNITCEYASDIDIAESPTTIDSYTPSSNGSTMWLYAVHDVTGANMRGGLLIVAHNTSNVVTSLSETQTADVGDTSAVTFAASMAGGTVSLTCSVTSDNWYVRVVRVGTDRLGFL